MGGHLQAEVVHEVDLLHDRLAHICHGVKGAQRGVERAALEFACHIPLSQKEAGRHTGRESENGRVGEEISA